MEPSFDPLQGIDGDLHGWRGIQPLNCGCGHLVSARILFDLDGTLIDSAPDIQGIANAALARLEADPITLFETRRFIGEGIGAFVTKMRAARGIPDREQNRLLADITALYDDAVSLTVTYPLVPETLRVLAQQHRLGICTNKLHRPTLSVLKHLGLAETFRTVWGGDNPLGRKPDSAALLAAFEELGTGPRLYVGDSETDAETARRAAIPFFLFTQGYRKSPVSDIPHDLAFDTFDQLPGLIAGYLAGQNSGQREG